MINRIQEQSEYHNIIQLAGLLVYGEMMEAFEAIKIYDNESGEWSIRRIFWYLVLGIPALTSILLISIAAGKYIWN